MSRHLAVRTTRRALAAVLSLLMIATMLPVSAGAAPQSSSLPGDPASVSDGFAQARLSSAVRGLDVGALAADDEIPGITVTSPYNGAIDLINNDYVDVFRVTVGPGEVFTAEITMSTGEWVAAALLPPGSTNVWEDEVSEFSTSVSSTKERLSQYSSAGGVYYLALFAIDADGTGATLGDGYLGYTVSFQSSSLGDYSDVGTARALGATQSDSLNWRTDVNDVYHIDLNEGDQLYLTASGTEDVLLNLWGPDAASVWSPHAPAQYDWSSGTNEVVYLVPPGGDGRYDVEVFADVLSLNYTLTSSVSRPQVPRVSGANRYSTSTAIGKANWSTSSAAVLATGNDPADALAASALAGALGAPVILVPPYAKASSLWGVYRELDRLGCSDIYIVGGGAAVDYMIEYELAEEFGYTVSRISGSNRYATAAAVAEEVRSISATDTVFVVRGDDFADALAVSPYAYAQGIPVLLTKPDSLNGSTAAFIENRNVTNVVVAGGTAAVSAGVVGSLEALNGGATNVVRRYGSSRYSTARSVADYAVDDMGWASWDFIGVATGQSFPDALSGGAACGQRGGVLLLTKSTSLRDEVSSAIEDNEPTMVMVFGGTVAVSSAVRSSIQGLMPPP